jgi:hypothetical protein
MVNSRKFEYQIKNGAIWGPVLMRMREEILKTHAFFIFLFVYSDFKEAISIEKRYLTSDLTILS